MAARTIQRPEALQSRWNLELIVGNNRPIEVPRSNDEAGYLRFVRCAGVCMRGKSSCEACPIE
jgi:hypothetical protein